MSKLKTLAYLLVTGLAATEYMREGNDYPSIDTQRLPRITCKDCYFYMGGTYCKRVKHHVNKQTPANRCAFFKTK